MWSGRPKLRAGAALAAASLAFALAGCGGGERRDAGTSADATYTVDIVRAEFPRRQQLADMPTFTLTLRNAGDETIPRPTVVVRGFSDRGGNASEADPRELVWLVDEAPARAVTAIEDTWTTSALRPGASTTLRWHVEPVVAGTHRLEYRVVAGAASSARVRLRGGGRAAGSITVRVAGDPPRTRVNPSTGAVERE